MKRAVILAIGILAIAAATTFAQTPVTPQAPGTTTVGPKFIDANGDGICDYYQAGTPQGPGQGQGRGAGRGMGRGVGPRDGSGYGAPAGAGTGTGTGICDGTGPKGKGRGPRK
ncbi:MAG: hypothetical protein WCP29_06200 [Acidobacteriota bacterium]